MSFLLSLFVSIAGGFLIAIAFKSIIEREISERQSLFWIISGCVIVFFGIFPSLSGRLADFFGVVYAPSIIFAIALLMAMYGIFQCFRDIASLKKRQQELAMQVSLLNQENAVLLKELMAKREPAGKHDERLIREERPFVS